VIGVQHRDHGPGVHQAPAAERAELGRILQQVEQRDVVRLGGVTASAVGRRRRGTVPAAPPATVPVPDEQPSAVGAGDIPASRHPLDAIPGDAGRHIAAACTVAPVPHVGSANRRPAGVDPQHAVHEHLRGGPTAAG